MGKWIVVLLLGAQLAIGDPASARQPPPRCRVVKTSDIFYTLSAGHVLTFQQYVVERCRGKLSTDVAYCDPLWWPLGMAPPPSWPYGVWDGGTWPETCVA